jgi:hypothetical protein
LLCDKDFCDSVKQFWSGWRTKRSDFPDHGNWWDIGKFRLKQLAISASVRLAKQRASDKLALEREYQSLNRSRTDPTRMQNILSELELLHSRSLEGIKIRSKAEWIEEGEKPTRFFFNLESKNQSKHTITALTTSGGEVNTNPDILSALREFYKNLYMAENTDPLSQDFSHARGPEH